MLLTGLTLFSSASLLAGVAGSAGLLIGARALQGFGAALLPPAALSIIAVTFAEGTERNRALGIYGAVTGISASVGVIASGLLTDGPGWRWVFFINVPVGVLLIAMAALFLAADAPGSRRSERFDVAGAVTVTGGLLLLVYALNRGADFGWGVRVDARTVRRVRRDAVRFRADRSAVSVTAGAALVSAQPHAGGGEPLGVLHLRSVLRLSLPRFAVHAAGSRLFADPDGVSWLATSATSFFAAAITGSKLVAVAGVRRLLVAGLSLFAISALLLTRVHAGGNFGTGLLPALVLAGVAGGLSAPAAQIGALSGVANSLTGLAAGLIETMREIGGAVGVAAVSTVLVSRAGEIAGAAGPAARGLAAANAFHAAFWVVFAVAALGALTAAIAFPRRTVREPGPAASDVSIVPEPTGRA